MHVRHEPKPTSAKQRMKGTPWGGKPLGAPRGPSCSFSQLDAVCCGMGLARVSAGTAVLVPRGCHSPGHCGQSMQGQPWAPPKPQSQELVILPEDLGQGSAGDWGFTADTQRLKHPRRGWTGNEPLTLGPGWTQQLPAVLVIWDSRAGHRPGAQWLHRETRERPGGCTSAMATCQQSQTTARSINGNVWGVNPRNTLWTPGTLSTGHLLKMLQPVLQSYKHPLDQDTADNFPSLHITDMEIPWASRIVGWACANTESRFRAVNSIRE